MFSMEIHLVQRALGIIWLGKTSMDAKQKHAPRMEDRLSAVFDHNKRDEDFDICI